MTEAAWLPSPGDGIAEGIAAAIRERTPVEPAAGVVLGSGLGRVIDIAGQAAGRSDGVEFSYEDLPGFPSPSVLGHAGRMWIGELGERPVVVFRGRLHFYEGHPMALAALTSRVAALLGARVMVLTAAAGALDRALDPGTLVVLRDHINAMGENPLRGWRMPDGSPPFVDLSQVYDPDLAAAALAAAAPVVEGVYAAVSGPSYETPAESESLRRAGGTVVGMSVVPEAVAARALGMRVLGLSFVTNAPGVQVSHEEVLVASETASEAIGRVLVEVLGRF